MTHEGTQGLAYYGLRYQSHDQTRSTMHFQSVYCMEMKLPHHEGQPVHMRGLKHMHQSHDQTNLTMHFQKCVLHGDEITTSHEWSKSTHAWPQTSITWPKKLHIHACSSPSWQFTHNKCFHRRLAVTVEFYEITNYAPHKVTPLQAKEALRSYVQRPIYDSLHRLNLALPTHWVGVQLTTFGNSFW